MRQKILNIIVFMVILLSLLVGFYFLPRMNDEVATHWNSKGEADGFSSKLFSILLIPILMVILYFIFLIIPRIDPLKKNIQSFRDEFNSFIVFIFIFFLYLQIITIIYNIGVTINISKWMIPAFGLLLYRTGILITKSKKNWFIGIKTPWTLSNDFVWDRTHRVSGNILKIIGIIIIFTIFVYNWSYIIFFSLLTLYLIFVFVYSYILYEKYK